MKPSEMKKIIKNDKKTDLEKFKAFAALVKSVSEKKEANAKFDPINKACDTLKLSDPQKNLILNGLVTALFTETENKALMTSFERDYNGKKEDLPEVFIKQPLDIAAIIKYFEANKGTLDNSVKNLMTAAALLSRDKYDLDALNFGAMKLHGDNLKFNLQIFSNALSGAAKAQTQLKSDESKSNPVSSLISKEEGFVKEQVRFIKAASGTTNFDYLNKAMKKSLKAHQQLLTAMKEEPFPSENVFAYMETLAGADRDVFVNLERFKIYQAQNPNDEEIKSIAASLTKQGSKMSSIQDVLMNVTNQVGQYDGPLQEINKKIPDKDPRKKQMADLIHLLDIVQKELNNSVQTHENNKRKNVVAKSNKMIDKIEKQKKSPFRRFASTKAKEKAEIELNELKLNRAMASVYLDTDDLKTIANIKIRETESIPEVSKPKVEGADAYVDTVIVGDKKEQKATVIDSPTQLSSDRADAFKSMQNNLSSGAKEQLKKNLFELSESLNVKTNLILKDHSFDEKDDIKIIKKKQDKLENLLLQINECSTLINGANNHLDPEVIELQFALSDSIQDELKVQTELNLLRRQAHDLKAKDHKKEISKHKDDYEFYTDFIPRRISEAGRQADKIKALEGKEMHEAKMTEMKNVFNNSALNFLKSNLQNFISTHTYIINNIKSTIDDIPNHKQRQKAYGLCHNDLKSKIENIDILIKKLEQDSTNLFIYDKTDEQFNSNLDYLEKYKLEKIKLLEQQLNLAQQHSKHLITKLPKTVSKDDRDTLLAKLDESFEVNDRLSTDEKIKLMKEQLNHRNAVIDAINPNIIHQKSTEYVSDRIKNKLSKIAKKSEFTQKRIKKGEMLTQSITAKINQKSQSAAIQTQGTNEFSAKPSRQVHPTVSAQQMRDALAQDSSIIDVGIAYDEAMDNLNRHTQANSQLEQTDRTVDSLTCSYRGTLFTLKKGENGEALLEMPKTTSSDLIINDFITEKPLDLNKKNTPKAK